MQPGPVKTLSIWANTSPCAHICRFCQIGDRARQPFPLERWRRVVQRFREWNAARGDGLEIDHGWLGPAMNFDLADYARLEDWLGERFSVIPFGGVRARGPEEMRVWLLERQARGLKRIHAALVGMGADHDRWVGRRGDFEFLLRTFRTAIDIGMQYSVTLYLTQTTLPTLDRLADLLDALPRPPEYKHVRQFYYGGYAAHHERERITEAQLEQLPEWARDAFDKHFTPRTEQAWMDIARTAEPLPVDLRLTLELTHDNIDDVDGRTCDGIFEALRSRAENDLERLPPLSELAERFGNPEAPYIYSRFETTRLWTDRFLECSGIPFDRTLMHEHIGRNAPSPLVWRTPATPFTVLQPGTGG